MMYEIECRLTIELGGKEQKIADLNRKLSDQEKRIGQIQEIISTFQVGSFHSVHTFIRK